METPVPAMLLRAALIRNGVWLIDVNGNATEFYHHCCFKHVPPVR